MAFIARDGIMLDQRGAQARFLVGGAGNLCSGVPERCGLKRDHWPLPCINTAVTSGAVALRFTVNITMHNNVTVQPYRYSGGCHQNSTAVCYRRYDGVDFHIAQEEVLMATPVCST